MFIEELDLSVRLYNFCKRNGVNTWADLAGVSVQDINGWCHEPNGHLGLKCARELAEAQRTIARAANPSHEWTDEQADLLAAAAVTAGHYPVVTGPREAPRCPYCGLVMSNREAAEQGACNECYGGPAELDPEPDYARLPGETVHEWNCRMGLA